MCLSSTQFFRSSPFFLTIRAAMGDERKAMTDNAFDIHDKATTSSRVGRVRQTVTDDKLTSEVDLEVGLFPGLPFRIKGTVMTVSSLAAVSPEKWETRIENTLIKGSNVPFFNALLDDMNLSLPVGEVYSSITGGVPVVPMNTFYVDEGMRITRGRSNLVVIVHHQSLPPSPLTPLAHALLDVDDNFFVFTRA